MTKFAAIATFLLASAFLPLAHAAEPDGLVLPPGFHASVVGDVGPHARHLAFGPNGDLYVSTIDIKSLMDPKAPGAGILVVKLDKDHKAGEVQHFSSEDNGTGIRFYKGMLYAATPAAIYRFKFSGNEEIPSAAPEVVVDGMPTTGSPNRGLAFDGKGGMFVSVPGASNNCEDKSDPGNPHPKGLNPCPELKTRAGIWRFDAMKTGQHFPADGEQIATGVRDMQALSWSHDLNGLYAAMQGRNGAAHALNPSVPGTSGDNYIAEEMHRVDKGTDLGWPYTYYDIDQHKRVLAPEYGGDGKMPAEGHYSDPVAAFPGHASPLDIAFYDGGEFPRSYRGGAFVVFHGGLGPDLPEGHNGYDVKFVPFGKTGKAGTPVDFIEGFAGPDASDRNASKAAYRPVGAAVAKDGSLYVVDGNKGRIWRITYSRP
ncbi:MAG TPA: hypothetical protein VHX99_07105 [Rhizomicrobium sp.]|nr:hypothetical protein [Rhizomicrobium sp.]